MTFVDAQDEASFNFFLHSLAFQTSNLKTAKPRGWSPSKGHKINLSGHEMINGKGQVFCF